MQKFLIITLSVLAISTYTYAQTDSTLTRTVSVERDFSPIVRDANKIDQIPVPIEIKVKKSKSTYADWTASLISSNKFNTMPVGNIYSLEKNRNGYIDFSAGNNVNANLDTKFFYKDFSFEADGIYTNAELEAPNYYKKVLTSAIAPYMKWENKFLNGNVKVGYAHRFSNEASIRVHAGMSGRKYNMFMLVEPESQKSGKLFAETEFEFRGFTIGAGFDHSSIALPDESESSVTFNIGYSWMKNSNKFDIKINSGIQLAEEDFFIIEPELMLTHYNEDNQTRVYLGISGGITRPDLFNLIQLAPFAEPGEYDVQKKIFGFSAGYENNYDGNFKWGAYAIADYYNDLLDCIMNFENERAIQRLTTIDKLLVKAGAYFNFEANRLFKSKVKAEYNSCPVFNKTKFNASAHILSDPTKKLTIDLGLDAGIMRKMDVVFENLDNEEYDMGNILDLNIRAEYRLKDNFSLYVFGKNLLNEEYDVLPCIPSQKINIHAGFNWYF